MHGIRRVLVFCTLTTILPTMLLVIPLYLRHSFYANVVYAVTESDILEVNDGISTIFCSEHKLQMNGTFNAFQMAHKPEITSSRKHIRLKKSMSLPDDTLEYWGFYLLKGATVALSVCSRFDGASILVVKGERNLRTCGMLEHNTEKRRAQGIFFPEASHQVKITFESNAQEINSAEISAPWDQDEALTTLNDHSKVTTTPSTTIGISIPPKSISDSIIKDRAVINDFGTNDDKIETRTDGNNNTNESTTKEISQDIELAELYKNATSYVRKHMENEKSERNGRKLRHARHRRFRHRHRKHETEDRADRNERSTFETLKLERIALLEAELNSDGTKKEPKHKYKDFRNINLKENLVRSIENEDLLRPKRSQELMKPPSLLDQGIMHGGTALKNGSDVEDKSSVSSFEDGLFNCYGGSILLAQKFEPSEQCVNVSSLLTLKHMQTKHTVLENGYYYYIFYSDNDIVSNDIHAVFDIYKPTFQYENVTDSCVNKTECTFTLSFMSKDRVIVEIPTRDGIEHEVDDANLLVSICHPRMGTYAVFPIAVLFLILGCAFM